MSKENKASAREIYAAKGRECGLVGNTLRRYARYMVARWEDTAEMKCRDGYAAEWAGRFAKGNEFGASDLEGQTVLGEIDGPTPAMLKSVK